MDGLLFYWFAWMGWIWTTFFMSRQSKSRFILSLGLLVLIISSPYRIQTMGIDIHAPAYVLILFYLVDTVTLRKRTFFSVFLSSFIIMLGYVSFLLFELFDPIWIIFDRKWMIAICSVCLCSILQSNNRLRIIAIVSGMIQGEVLFSFVMKRLSLSYPVGSPAFLDIIAISAMLIVVWTAFSSLASFTDSYLNQGRGKQRTS